MSNKTDFVTENGELKSYVGKDTKVIIPEGVVSLGKFCFEDSNVEQIVVPSTVQNIEAVAFLETPNLQSIVVDEKNTTYCSVDGCLYSKDKTKFICCPNRNTPLYIADGCESIERCAFFQRKVAKVVFPQSIKRLQLTSLANCFFDADEMVIPQVEFCWGEWFNATILPPRVVLQGFTTLPAGAFSYSRFGSMRLPDTLVEIEAWAFAYCNMSRVYVPKSVVKIAEDVFVAERIRAEIDVEEFYDPTEGCGLYDDEFEQVETAPQEHTQPCPDGFVLGVDSEDSCAAQYAREHNIPYQVVSDIQDFLNVPLPIGLSKI